MPGKLLVCCLARNEASRFLPSALDQWGRFADEILLLDDASTDNTGQLAIDAGCIVHYRDGGAWGNEAPARQQLFDLALSHTDHGDFILWLDADMVPANDPRELAFGGHSGAWAFNLYDIWQTEPLRYRHDVFWRAHENPRIWMIRRPTDNDWVWPDRGIHCGHLPLNFQVERGVGTAPQEYSLLHYAYSSPELRQQKYQQYMSVEKQLSNFEWRHAQTILDADPTTYRLPYEPRFSLELAHIDAEAA